MQSMITMHRSMSRKKDGRLAFDRHFYYFDLSKHNIQVTIDNIYKNNFNSWTRHDIIFLFEIVTQPMQCMGYMGLTLFLLIESLAFLIVSSKWKG